MEQLEKFSGLFLSSQGQNLALVVLYVAHHVCRAWGGARPLVPGHFFFITLKPRVE